MEIKPQTDAFRSSSPVSDGMANVLEEQLLPSFYDSTERPLNEIGERFVEIRAIDAACCFPCTCCIPV